MVNIERASIPGLDPHQTLYGYIPTEWVCALFITLFTLSTLLHIAQAAKYKIWWLYPTLVLGGVCEILGWSGRMWSHFEPGHLDPYLMQICMTILAPSWLTAGNFTILGIIIRLLGPQYSWLSPRWYLIVFLSFDGIALVGQAVGGAQASLAAEQGLDPTPGGHIMCYFIMVQMGAISLYTICAGEFLLRYHFNKPVRSTPSTETFDSTDSPPTTRVMDRRIRLMLLGMAISTIFILIRSVYRTIELLDGWGGPIITNQLYFNILDGAAVVIAIFAINFFHPGFLLRDNAKTLDLGWKRKRNVES